MRPMEDNAASTAAPFYLNRVNASKEEGPSFEVRLLLPLKCLAYGVIDYLEELHKGLARIVSR
jgi:hypothetical protein